MTFPWMHFLGFAGVLVGSRIRLSTGDRKPIVGLFSLAIAIGLLLILSLLPKILELPVFLLIGIFVGLGVKLLDERDGYLVRDNDPEVELDR